MRFFNIPWKWNVPNALSLLRIALVPVFMVLYLIHRDGWAILTLVLSGLTDMLDGFIARRFNQITDCGKLLDPVSDKLTQVGVVIALTTRHQELMPLLVLCLLKELSLIVGSVIMLRRRHTMRAAKWFGKLSTALFYTCMALLVVFPDMPAVFKWVLIGIVGVSMLLAFIGYLWLFIANGRPSTAAEPEDVPEKG